MLAYINVHAKSFIEKYFRLNSSLIFNPLMLTAAKSSLTMLMIFCREKQSQENI